MNTLNQQAAPIMRTNTTAINQSLTNLRQLYYVLEMMKNWKDCFMRWVS